MMTAQRGRWPRNRFATGEIMERALPHSRSRGQLVPAIVFDCGLWMLDAVIPSLQRLHVTPNFLSLISIPASLCAAALVASGHFGIAGPVVLLAFSLDACDGALARRLGTASDAGEIVDATIDRYNDLIIMLGFLYYFRLSPISWLVAAAALVGTVAVSYVRAKGASFGIDADIGFMQRHERALWLGVSTSSAPAIAALFEEPSRNPSYYAVLVALGMLAIGTNITAIRRARLVVETLVTRQRNCPDTDRRMWGTASP
jgi:phosphatidylglycerophosphate synthase